MDVEVVEGEAAPVGDKENTDVVKEGLGASGIPGARGGMGVMPVGARGLGPATVLLPEVAPKGAWGVYLEGILSGRVTGCTVEESRAAYGVYRGWLVPGRRCFVNGRPVELLYWMKGEVVIKRGVEVGEWQDWMVRPLFVEGRDCKMRIQSRDRLKALHSVGR